MPEVNTFWPLMMKVSLPDRSARVVSAAASEPDSGSVRPKQ